RGGSGNLSDNYTGTIINQGTIAADNSVDPGQFGYDSGFSGGNTSNYYYVPIDTSGAGAEAAPTAVYQTDREGTFSYTFSGLTPGVSYDLRLHLAEDSYNAPNQHKI